MSEFLPNIDDYLEQNAYGEEISTDGLEKLIFKIVVHTGFKYEICEIIVKYYFQEIRNKMLRGDIIYIKNIGRIYIKCPRNGTSTRAIFAIIKPFKRFLKKIKYDD